MAEESAEKAEGYREGYIEGYIESIEGYIEGYIVPTKGYIEGYIAPIERYIEGYIKSIEGYIERQIEENFDVKININKVNRFVEIIFKKMFQLYLYKYFTLLQDTIHTDISITALYIVAALIGYHIRTK